MKNILKFNTKLIQGNKTNIYLVLTKYKLKKRLNNRNLSIHFKYIMC